MHKVLLISYFYENSGWGEAARNMALAMDSVGIDVVCRNVNGNNPTAEINEKLQFLLNKDDTGCDICVQHLLPSMMYYDGNFKKCIGSFVTESNNIELSNYPTHLNFMDELWTSSEYCKQAAINLGIDHNKIKIVPHAFDRNNYHKNYSEMDIPELKSSYVFYYIGEAIKRKNLMALVKAFHMEFSPNEPVELVLKVTKPGLNYQQTAQFMKEFCDTAKTNLKLYKNIEDYKSEIIITGMLTKEELYKLHNSCDCFVLTSYGEGWCIPLWEAAAMGNFIISPDVGGHMEYIKNTTKGIEVKGSNVPCFGFTDSGLPELSSAREDCYEINIRELMKEMRNVYSGATELSRMTGKNKIKFSNSNLIETYSYTSVGNIIKELICI